ncbi:hypothetical protein MUCCIDRAFT_116360 [Mucor lusitanicus CBS 277.49]|uniref:Fungal-type protein kinase domain-containing protein n=3 Tax=Mucor circinelloides f. lusitanicus TaxID=29924 RepID=A0A168GCF8_MUCCL|nr:hypothetical protein MUCCIDRAFT_116360 [Mucor lusitanicus CBS 277.49]
MKEKINDVAKSADADDYRMIDIIINCINKISDSTRVNEEIGEAELQGNYIDPIMYPMFHNPQANMHFRWLNRQVADTVTRRPDGHIYKMRQRKIHSSIGFVEVKPNKSECAKRHEDMIRLAVFCKDALESQKSNNMIAVQVVGFYISFYLLASTDDDYYLMVELYSFETAKYLSQLPHLLSSFDNLKQIMAFNKNNAELQETTTKKRSRSQDTPDLTRIINIKKPKSVAPSLSFHK